MQNHKLNKSRIIFLVAIVSGSLCLLCGIAVGSYYWFWIQPKVSLANDLNEWVPENSTPGTYLIIKETGRKTKQGMTRIYYEAAAHGLPPHTDFTLCAYDKLLLKETGVWSLQSDAAGTLILERFSVSNFVRGELLVFTWVSDDSEVQVYARLFPFPIEAAGDGGCHVWVELVNTRATSFAVYGEGFQPKEILESGSVINEGVQMQSNIQTDENGRLTSFMFPETIGKQSGTVKETFVGQKCEVTIEYEWGLSALKVQ